MTDNFQALTVHTLTQEGQSMIVSSTIGVPGYRLRDMGSEFLQAPGTRWMYAPVKGEYLVDGRRVQLETHEKICVHGCKHHNQKSRILPENGNIEQICIDCKLLMGTGTVAAILNSASASEVRNVIKEPDFLDELITTGIDMAGSADKSYSVGAVGKATHFERSDHEHAQAYMNNMQLRDENERLRGENEALKRRIEAAQSAIDGLKAYRSDAANRLTQFVRENERLRQEVGYGIKRSQFMNREEKPVVQTCHIGDYYD